MNRLQTRIGIVGAGSLAVSFLTGILVAAPGDGAGIQDAKPAKAQERKAAPQGTGQLTGTVKFDGQIPEAKPLSIPKNAAQACCPPGKNVDAVDRSLLISEGGGLQNVVVTVKVEGVDIKLPEKPYPLDQKGCRFIPHVLVVPKGATVAFLNSDETTHNVHLIALANDAMNKTVTAGGRTEQAFPEAEPVKVICDMHTWMNAWVYVADATHWTLTDANGNFSLDGLPPGEHEVTFWHEKLKSQQRKITVGEDGKVAAPMEVKFAPKKTKRRRRHR